MIRLNKRQFMLGSAGTVLAAAMPWSANAQRKNIMVLASNVDIPNFDPHVATGYAPQWLFRNTYDALVRVVGTPPETKPGLAKSWTRSDDGKTYVFELDERAVFHDGTPVTAKDVEYSFARLLRVKQGPAWMVSGILDETSVKATGERTVTFTLLKPFAPLLSVLPWMFVVNSAVVEANLGSDDGQSYLLANIAGSGAFTIGRARPGDLYELIRAKDDWHQGGNIDGVIWKIVRETATTRLMLQRGDIQFALELYAEDMEALKDMPKVVRIMEPDYRSFSIKMNTARGPLADKNLRKAISYAYNYQAMLEAAGQAELMQGPLPTGMFGHAEDLEVYRHNMEKAKEYLAKSEHKDGGFTLSISHAAGYENQRRWCLILLEALKALNIELDIRPLVWPDIVAMAKSPDTMTDFYSIFQSANYADPDNTVFAGYHSSRNGQWQNPVYNNPDADRLIDAARAEVDTEKRAALYKELQEVLVDDAPDIFGVMELRKFAMRDNVQNYEFCPVAANTFEVWPLSLA
ncbi:ABC transporter substrate-binding protein [Nitratireductor aquimarinus]|uniref:ABC transporter substrate-binding protein n=1 Tax=Nitratireductor aquimarinus TaxID=889300 RepID=UPI001A90846F|nr:ABC transporter substrate-binding protein [Nitratireductor aquimarinus]MBN8245756.1 ABC transporter substrate-binding protein [Nitratireductor aquimarinus]MBY6134138.1 ABC transporter substrate-binding protein [Nitratireductor aquimarinus]MCA1305230.1 ABC transporter substrate-binding protein [Nitratireductor aquimarinus]